MDKLQFLVLIIFIYFIFIPQLEPACQMFCSKVISFESDVQTVTQTHTHKLTGPRALPGPLEWSVITVLERQATRNWVYCQFIWSCSIGRDRINYIQLTVLIKGVQKNVWGVITRCGYVRGCSVFNDVDYSLAVYTYFSRERCERVIIDWTVWMCADKLWTLYVQPLTFYRT